MLEADARSVAMDDEEKEDEVDPEEPIYGLK
jgi:hypothetical protein